MAGIYLHIPFCRKACLYCDFHFSTSLGRQDEMCLSMEKELRLRQGEVQGPFNSLYFGGGTPSLLKPDQIKRFIDLCQELYGLAPHAEITLEANPDDLHREALKAFLAAGINRLSIGIQSFFEEDLAWMNRSHTSEQAVQCLNESLDIGFSNISLDLIFGYPLLSSAKWESNIRQALSFPITHISCYSMTVEEKTALHHQVKKGLIPPMPEEQASGQYLFLLRILKEEGWEHYEISNFARPGYRAIHNSSYWTGSPYLGIGPSAHGYTGSFRYWNVRNNSAYIQSLQEEKLPEEREELNLHDRFNEWIMVSLRTSEGLNILTNTSFPADWLLRLKEGLKRWQEKSMIICEGNTYQLSENGLLIADHLISDLFEVSAE